MAVLFGDRLHPAVDGRRRSSQDLMLEAAMPPQVHRRVEGDPLVLEAITFRADKRAFADLYFISSLAGGELQRLRALLQRGSEMLLLATDLFRGNDLALNGEPMRHRHVRRESAVSFEFLWTFRTGYDRTYLTMLLSYGRYTNIVKCFHVKNLQC